MDKAGIRYYAVQRLHVNMKSPMSGRSRSVLFSKRKNRKRGTGVNRTGLLLRLDKLHSMLLRVFVLYLKYICAGR